MNCRRSNYDVLCRLLAVDHSQNVLSDYLRLSGARPSSLVRARVGNITSSKHVRVCWVLELQCRSYFNEAVRRVYKRSVASLLEILEELVVRCLPRCGDDEIR